jgi:hypothetical protein
MLRSDGVKMSGEKRRLGKPASGFTWTEARRKPEKNPQILFLEKTQKDAEWRRTYLRNSILLVAVKFPAVIL